MTRHSENQRISRLPLSVGKPFAAVLCAGLALAACARTPPPAAFPPPQASGPASGAPDIWRAARIVASNPPLECVPFARNASGIAISGDASTWWDRAAGRYGRGPAPQPGAVLAFRPAARSSGHLAVVRQVVEPRLIVVDHANWLSGGHIHENTPVRDISPRNDWSAVQVWYTPGQAWGTGTYPTHGFIYAKPVLTVER